MASQKPDVTVSEESSEVQVLDSIEPLVTASSSTPSSSSARVLDSIEPLVPTAQSILDESVAGPSGMASGSGGSQPAIASSMDEDENNFAIMPMYRPTGSSGRRMNPYSDELRFMWSWFKIYSTFATHDQCVQFAEERGLLPTEKICSYHHTPMTLSMASSKLGKFRCRKKNCKTKDVSRSKGTWFENVRLPLPLVFQIMFAFCREQSYNDTKCDLAHLGPSVLSSATISDWYNYCREVVAIYEIQNQRVQGKIGGPNKIVQIDESKCGKRKYNRGRHIEGHWIIGMIEDGNDDLRLEVCPDNERSADVLIPLIKKHVAEGSIIHTDHWRAYASLPDHGYIHKRVNHSDPINKFVASDGTHTQRIESQWRGLKTHFRRRQHKTDFSLWLGEFSWRRHICINHLDRFEELLKAIKYVYPVNR